MASKSVIVLGIVFLFTYAAEATRSNSNEQETQLSNIFVVKGTVFCDTRLENPFSESAYFLPGALVSVDCSIISNRKWKISNGRVSINGETDENGEFRVEIPIMHNINPRRSCSVRLLNSPHDSCDIHSIPASSQLTLSSSNSNGIQTYVFTPLSFRPSTEQERVIMSSLPRRRASEDSTSKATSSSPPLPSIPQLPKFSSPPLPSISPLPKLTFPPLPTIPALNIPNIVAPPLPKLSVPPLPGVPTVPKLSVPSLPKLSVPPLPSVPTIPKLSVSPLPNIPTLPNLNFPPLPSAPTLPNQNIPPLPNLPPLNIPNAPPLPTLSFPPLPFAFPFPPFPFFTPPPPSTNNQSP